MKDNRDEGREITEKFKRLISEVILTEAGGSVESTANAIKSTEDKYYKLQKDSQNLVLRIKSLFKPFNDAATKEYKRWVYTGYKGHADYIITDIVAYPLGYSDGDDGDAIDYAIDINIENSKGHTNCIQVGGIDEFFEKIQSKFKKS